MWLRKGLSRSTGNYQDVFELINDTVDMKTKLFETYILLSTIQEAFFYVNLLIISF